MGLAGPTAAPKPRRKRAVSVTRPLPLTEPTDWSFRAAGVDSLDVSLHVDWGSSANWLFTALEHGKEQAKGTKGIPWGSIKDL